MKNSQLTSEIIDAAKPVVIVAGRERDIESLLQTKDVGITRFIRGARCKSEQSHFQEWAAALQFPYYFGGNWDAFDECINDLSWLESTSYRMVITNADKIMPDVQEGFSTLLTLLLEAAAQWQLGAPGSEGKRKALFSIILHCENENMDSLKSQTSHLRIEASPIVIPVLDNVR